MMQARKNQPIGFATLVRAERRETGRKSPNPRKKTDLISLGTERGGAVYLRYRDARITLAGAVFTTKRGQKMVNEKRTYLFIEEKQIAFRGDSPQGRG